MGFPFSPLIIKKNPTPTLTISWVDDSNRQTNIFPSHIVHFTWIPPFLLVLPTKRIPNASTVRTVPYRAMRSPPLRRTFADPLDS